MSSVSPATSQKIKNMSIVCALLVVTIHVGWPHDRICFTWFIHELIRCGLAQIAVPFFFVVSGFFLAAHFEDDGWYGKELRKRVSSLLVPFVAWLVISKLLLIPPSIIADHVAHRPFGTSLAFFTDWQWLLQAFGLDPRETIWGDGALWYVRCLLLFTVISPMFKYMVKEFGLRWLVFMYVIVLTVDAITWTTSMFYVINHGVCPLGMFYFSIGAYLCINKQTRTNSKVVTRCCVLVSICLLSLKTILSYYNIVSQIPVTTLAIPFMLYSVWSLMPNNKWPSWFTNFSFPLYVMHMTLRPYFELPLKHFHLHPAVFSMIEFVGIIVVPFAVTQFLNHKTPRLAKLLFAGRS